MCHRTEHLFAGSKLQKTAFWFGDKKKKKSCKLTASFTFLCPGCDRNKLVTVNLSEGGEGVTSSLLTGLTAQLFPEV